MWWMKLPVSGGGVGAEVLLAFGTTENWGRATPEKPSIYMGLEISHSHGSVISAIFENVTTIGDTPIFWLNHDYGRKCISTFIVPESSPKKKKSPIFLEARVCSNGSIAVSFCSLDRWDRWCRITQLAYTTYSPCCPWVMKKCYGSHLFREPWETPLIPRFWVQGKDHRWGGCPKDRVISFPI